VESPHTAEEYLEALDETLALGSDILDQYYFGCQVDVHVGWAIVDAESEAEALGNVPASLRDKARAVQVEKFTPEQIQKEHEV
jgi:hypothetical protein